MVDREIINLLKIARRQKKITIVELCAKLGVSQQWYAQVENGSVVPTKEEVKRIRAFVDSQ